MRQFILIIFLLNLSCTSPKNSKDQPINNTFVLFDEQALEVLDTAARFETLSCGYEWTEGPLWIEEGRYLLFSDIPTNTIYKYESNGKTSIYLRPSGYTGDSSSAHQPGSNGLILDKDNSLVLLQQGDRRVARMPSPLDEPRPEFETIADTYDGKRLNSPNDAVLDSLGNIYFTDPTYGLAGGDDDPDREIDFHGVYCVKTDGTLILLDTMDRPNGITLSPQQDKLYVSVSNWEEPTWYQYHIPEPGKVTERQVLFTTEPVPGSKNAPDGMVVSKNGMIFTSGPGGAWLLSADGQALARINVPSLVSNCTLDTKEKYLYLTADDCLLRIKLKK